MHKKLRKMSFLRTSKIEIVRYIIKIKTKPAQCAVILIVGKTLQIYYKQNNRLCQYTRRVASGSSACALLSVRCRCGPPVGHSVPVRRCACLRCLPGWAAYGGCWLTPAVVPRGTAARAVRPCRPPLAAAAARPALSAAVSPCGLLLCSSLAARGLRGSPPRCVLGAGRVRSPPRRSPCAACACRRLRPVSRPPRRSAGLGGAPLWRARGRPLWLRVVPARARGLCPPSLGAGCLVAVLSVGRLRRFLGPPASRRASLPAVARSAACSCSAPGWGALPIAPPKPAQHAPRGFWLGRSMPPKFALRKSLSTRAVSANRRSAPNVLIAAITAGANL